MSGPSAFFDTNVLLYLYSRAEPAKQQRAKDLFREHAFAGSVLISTQVVQEFYAAGSGKLKLPRRELTLAVHAFLELPLVTVSAAHIRRALELEEQHGISFWDSLILAAAEAGGAEVLYTEDLNHGQRYGSVLVRNPFAGSDGQIPA